MYILNIEIIIRMRSQGINWTLNNRVNARMMEKLESAVSLFKFI